MPKERQLLCLRLSQNEQKRCATRIKLVLYLRSVCYLHGNVANARKFRGAIYSTVSYISCCCDALFIVCTIPGGVLPYTGYRGMCDPKGTVFLPF